MATPLVASDVAPLVVPGWLPSTPDETMNLCGGVPAEAITTGVVTQPEAEEAAMLRMTQGQRFWQYFHSSTGMQVRKSILVFYVADPSRRGAGKLYWSERSRRSISQNRCLAMDHITDIYLGAQTAVLKRATEIAAGASASGIQTTMPQDDLLFSLLSDTTMLDLEATSMPELCYWLFGLGIIMRANERAIAEKEAGPAEDGLNSSTRSIHGAADASMQMTDVEMDSLKRELLADPATHPSKRRHTRKFSVALGGQGATNESFAAALNESNASTTRASVATVPAAAARTRTMANRVVPVRSAFWDLRDAVFGEMADMSDFVTDGLTDLLAKAQAHTQAKQEVEEALAAEQRKRRRLQNKLIELQGNIRVFARVRPLSAAEEKEGGCIEFPGENLLALHSGPSDVAPKSFEFDRVYTPAITQAEVFRDVAPFVQSAVDGFSVCVFAYGQWTRSSQCTLGRVCDPPFSRLFLCLVLFPFLFFFTVATSLVCRSNRCRQILHHGRSEV